MKRKLICFIAALTALSVLAAGCNLGSYLDNGGSKNPDGTVGKPSKPNDPNQPVQEDNHYRASVYYGGQLFVPGDLDVNVVWRNDNEVVRVPLGQDGRADAGELDGDYYVYLEGVPSKYTYDPNEYIASSEERRVSLNLENIQAPNGGNGTGLYLSQGCYAVSLDGFYRAEVNSEYSTVYYEYKPSASGVYSVESKVNVYDDAINPTIDVYNGSTGFKFFNRTIDGGGFSLSGGYTRNFRYEVYVDETEVGSSFSFAVGAKCKSGAYPVEVDFRIKYEGEYSNSNSDVRIIRAKEAIKKAEEPRGRTFVTADLGTKTFDARNYRLNPNTNWYHYYDEELYGDNRLGYGAGYGPVVCCAIRRPIPCYTLTTLYNANATGLGGGSNYLKLHNVWIEAEQKFATYDYTAFIREDYNRVCNSDGVCYVTPELKAFLQKYAENYSLYTDGIVGVDTEYGTTPEELGYSANQDALWLFACGFYR